MDEAVWLASGGGPGFAWRRIPGKGHAHATAGLPGLICLCSLSFWDTISFGLLYPHPAPHFGHSAVGKLLYSPNHGAAHVVGECRMHQGHQCMYRVQSFRALSPRDVTLDAYLHMLSPCLQLFYVVLVFETSFKPTMLQSGMGGTVPGISVPGLHKKFAAGF